MLANNTRRNQVIQSKFQLLMQKWLHQPPALIWRSRSAAGVVELVDTQDLKSCFRMEVPVRFRPPAPELNS